MVVAPPTPARRYCPNRDRPAWLPPLKFHCAQDHYLQDTYGITCDDYWALSEQQGELCAICRKPPWPGRRLVVDHNHDTGAIDGLCHFGCNRRLPTSLRRYLADPPGRQLRLQVAPAKLRVIQEHDQAKRRRAQAKRVAAQQAKAGPPSDEEFARRVQAALEQTTEQGV
jgi:hypothetical protein